MIGAEAGPAATSLTPEPRPEVVLPPIEAAIRSGVEVTFDLDPDLVGRSVPAHDPVLAVRRDHRGRPLRMGEPAIRQRAAARAGPSPRRMEQLPPEQRARSRWCATGGADAAGGGPAGRPRTARYHPRPLGRHAHGGDRPDLPYATAGRMTSGA